MPYPKPENPTPDPSGWWLRLAVVSLVLMLAALYLGQGLPSLVYVVLVLGLFLAALVGLVMHHLYDMVYVGRAIREVVLKSRAGAAIFLVVGVALALKLLGIW